MKTRTPKRSNPLLGEMIIRRIKELRNTNSHTQEYVYEKTGLDLAHIETGRVVPSVISISVLCALYNITLHEFFAPLNYPPKE